MLEYKKIIKIFALISLILFPIFAVRAEKEIKSVSLGEFSTGCACNSY